MKGHGKKRIWLASACFVVAAVTAGFLIKAIFFPTPTPHGNVLLPSLAYFTTQSNILVMFWLVYTGVKELVPSLKQPAPILGFMVSCYISVTGVVYWLVLTPLLRFVPELFTMSNIWLHAVTSVFVPVVFFGFQYGAPIRQRGVVLMLSYPACYIIFAYILRAATGKYVYPFLSPVMMGGWLISLVSIVLIAALFVGLGFLYRAAWNKHTGQRIGHEHSVSI